MPSKYGLENKNDREKKEIESQIIESNGKKNQKYLLLKIDPIIRDIIIDYLSSADLSKYVDSVVSKIETASR
jgi:hypothetical protein